MDQPNPANSDSDRREYDAGERIALRVPHEPDDANGLSPILFCPPRQVLESRRIELDASHKPNFVAASSTVTPPSRPNAARRRSRMAGDFKR